ncbi:MAG: CDP-glycerol glycerophosphotransferase family protein [Rhodanobacter sp.]
MSGASWLRASLGGLWTVVISALGWVLIASWAALMPRRRDLLSVIGRDEGKFVDNSKYFFLQGAPLLNPSVRVVFVTERKDVADTLANSDYEVMIYPSLPAIWYLLRSGTLVVDSLEWTRHLRRFLTVRARVLQLWHGVGFKRVELDKWRHEVVGKSQLSSAAVLTARRLMHGLTGRLVHYDAVNTTSVFYRDRVFAPAFLSNHFLVTGYPRNTFGKLGGNAQVLAWRNVDAHIARQLPEWSSAKRRMVLVAPTFRDTRATPLGLTPEVTAMLDSYCEAHGVELVFKFHPLERSASEVTGRHLHLCDPYSDLYPLLPLSRALITDYSSIYMDYLLLDKPVLFLVPDLDRYTREDRQFQFDFSSMTPGPKVGSWADLVARLEHQLQHDEYGDARARLRLTAFDGLPQTEAVQKLIDFMREQRWIP